MIVGISGKFATGKDTLTNYLLAFFSEKGIVCSRLKFADALKKASSIITETKLEDTYSSEGKNKTIQTLGISIGRFQQLLGTVLREHIHPDIWVFPIIQYYKNNPDKFCIISDCRFKNEAAHIKQNGGILIRLNRNTNVNDGRDPNHISETDLDDYDGFDLVINNNGTPEEMFIQVTAFLQEKLIF